MTIITICRAIQSDGIWIEVRENGRLRQSYNDSYNDSLQKAMDFARTLRPQSKRANVNVLSCEVFP
jgi:hypothetical protein